MVKRTWTDNAKLGNGKKNITDNAKLGNGNNILNQ